MEKIFWMLLPPPDHYAAQKPIMGLQLYQAPCS